MPLRPSAAHRHPPRRWGARVAWVVSGAVAALSALSALSACGGDDDATSRGRPGESEEDGGGAPLDAARADAAEEPGEPLPMADAAPPAKRCVFDARTVYVENGKKIESVIAYGKNWLWNFDGNTPVLVPGFDGKPLETIDRFAVGPCAGQPAGACRFDSRAIYVENGKKIESVTAYGKNWLWNFDGSTAVVVPGFDGKPLETIERLSAGPCAGQPAGACRLDTRTVYVDVGAVKRESVTAYGKNWLWSFEGTTPTVVSGFDGRVLNDIARFAEGPCAGRSPCVLDTRTVYVDTTGVKVESITADGRYWLYTFEGDEPKLNAAFAGAPLTSVARFAEGPCR